MDQLLKPESTRSAPKEWKHWKKTFENDILAFHEREGAEQSREKLKALTTNCISYEVCTHIEDCAVCHTATDILQRLYAKKPNSAFARHLLDTAKQHLGQSLDDFLQRLHGLCKNCNFRSINAEEYRQETMRDAFVNMLSSKVVPQRILEKQELSLDQGLPTGGTCTLGVYLLI